MGASEIVNSDAFSGVRVRIFPHRCEPYPVSGVHKMPGFGRSGPFESGRKRVEILVVRLFRPAGGLFLRALAFGSERETQPERDIHRALADGDVLRREFRRRQVGRYEEVDPARAEVQRKAETSSAAGRARVARRQREPSYRTEVHRTRHAVQRCEVVEAGLVEQAESYPVVPQVIFRPRVERRLQHAGFHLAVVRAEAQQVVEREVGRSERHVVFHRDSCVFYMFFRVAPDVVFFVPVDESQVRHRERHLQVGQYIVCCAQVDCKKVLFHGILSIDLRCSFILLQRKGFALHIHYSF